jgi:small subunit ribosomal protein S17
MSNQAEQIKGTRQGVVETDARDKTRKVVIHFRAPHAKYGKYVSRQTVLHVNDEKNESKTGDVVEVAPCRPMSKTKFWTLVRVVERRSGD